MFYLIPKIHTRITVVKNFACRSVWLYVKLLKKGPFFLPVKFEKPINISSPSDSRKKNIFLREMIFRVQPIITVSWACLKKIILPIPPSLRVTQETIGFAPSNNNGESLFPVIRVPSTRKTINRRVITSWQFAGCVVYRFKDKWGYNNYGGYDKK